MENSIASKVVTKVTVAVLAIALVDLVFVNWWILEGKKKSDNLQSAGIQNGQVQEMTNNSNDVSVASSPLPTSTPTDSAATKATEPSPSPAQTQTTVTTSTVIQTANKEIFIPMGNGSTASGSYADLNGTDVTVDTTKYSNIESITFEASIWVENGNGRAYAQLYNVDDKNPYIESVISNNVSTPTVKSSGNIPYPSGRKTYRVRAKTDLDQYPAHVENARIKISLK